MIVIMNRTTSCFIGPSPFGDPILVLAQLQMFSPMENALPMNRPTP
jgi:hypothetical protein